MRWLHIWQAYRWPLVGALHLLALVLGYRGFMHHAALHGQVLAPLDAFYLSIQLVPLQSGVVPGPIPWELQIARFVAPLVFAYAAAVTVWEIFAEQTQLLRLRFLKDHIVVAGIGRKGLQLVSDLRRLGQRVVVLDRDHDNPNLRECREQGAIVLPGALTDYWLLQRARVDRARYLICTCGDDGTNVEIAVKAREIVAAEERGGEGLRTVVHLINAQLRKRLERQQAARAAPGARPMQFFNVYQEGARLLLATHPPVVDPALPADAPRDVIVVGFGRMGERVVLQLVRSGDFGDGRPLHLTVLDREAGLKERAFRRAFPCIDQLCTMQVHQVDTRDVASFLAALEPYARGARRASIAYVCLDSDPAGLECAMLLEDMLGAKHPPIIVRMEQDRGLATLLEESAGRGLYPFGVINRVCRADALLRYARDALARAIHAGGPCAMALGGHALECPLPRAPWEELPESVRNTNRQQADHVGVKLRAIGCRAVPAGAGATSLFAFRGDELERLARMEHARWRAEHLLAGWRCDPTLDPEGRTSPYLVDWDALPAAVQTGHRQAAELIPRHLADIGLVIERAK